MRIRIKFRRWGSMKFLGHLDMMRYFQRAIRRAGINVSYSEGFSPHQIMSFAAPLGVGITSDGEYFDIDVKDTFSTREALRRLNDAMVDGIAVSGYVLLPENAKKAMAIVAAAEYLLYYKEGFSSPCSEDEWKQMLQTAFLEKEEFLITKKSKKTENVIDLKKLVYNIGVEEKDCQPAFRMTVSTGSTDNLKPELVLASIFEACGLTYDTAAIQIHRTEVYADSENGRIPLLALGQEIE